MNNVRPGVGDLSHMVQTRSTAKYKAQAPSVHIIYEKQRVTERYNDTDQRMQYVAAHDPHNSHCHW